MGREINSLPILSTAPIGRFYFWYQALTRTEWLICRYKKDLPANMKYEWIDYRVLTIFPLTTSLPCSSRFRSLSINTDSLMFNSWDRWDIDAGEFEMISRIGSRTLVIIVFGHFS